MTQGTDLCIISLEETDSTNSYVREHFDQLPDGALVTAKFQTAGRGRLGRRWIAPPGVNFCGTFCLKNISDGFHAGILCGLALMDCVGSLLPDKDFYLKWPNDLYCGKAKTAGILGEGIIREGRIAGVAMGIGLNVNMDQESLDQVGQKAASFKTISGREFNLDFIAKKLAKSMNECYIMYSNSFDAVFAKWRSANRLIGRDIAVTDGGGVRYEGVFKDVTLQGEMLLEYRDETGVLKTRCFNCGDVSVDKSSI